MSDLFGNQIVPINRNEAIAFIEKWHYSNRYPSAKNINFAWRRPDLYAVAVYGIGVNPYQDHYLSNITGLSVDRVIELRRLARIEPKIEGVQLTQFLSGCHKLLKRQQYRFVISFSDPNEGHLGTIYKAANFIHLGKTNPENHCIEIKTGAVRHRRYYYRYAKRNNVTAEQARKALGLTLVRYPAKDRWLLPLYKKDRSRINQRAR